MSHVFNIFRGSKPVVDFLKSDRATVDFCKVIDSPPEAEATPASLATWRLENWGTKFDAFNSRPGGGGVVFRTFDTPPVILFEKLAVRFPSCSFELLWSGPVVGYDAGQLLYKGYSKEIVGGTYADTSDDADRVGLWVLTACGQIPAPQSGARF